MHVCAHWTLETLRAELAKTEEFIEARAAGMAPKQIGLKAAARRAEQLRGLIAEKERDDA